MFSIKNYPNVSYGLINNVMGWVVFLIASITYILTCEPTTSLWDCGEFITTSVGLQVGHPPGAPLFMIISRLFAIFAPSPEKLALMCNYMSALSSGFTILFLFWTISHLARKLVLKESKEASLSQVIAIMGAATIGALTYTFSDTFWFSAVEGEVYALSSLFTAVVFWAILKWENVANEKHSNRWLILIAYLIGLSIGVHLLNLLAIPAIVFVYYFKKFKPTKNGVIKTAAIALVILGFVNFMLIPGVIKVAGWFELLFVNGFGLPFNTGVLFYALLIIAGLTYGIRYTLKTNRTILNTILSCFVVILIGYSSYSMVVIRSISNPPIDENSPDNVFSLLSYINREQYGDSPLLYGHYYNAPILESVETDPIYYQNKRNGVYDLVGYKIDYNYDERFCTFFPRMHSRARASFPQDYEQWGGRPNGPSYMVNGTALQRPSFGNNLKFFFRYQIGHMYWRYFMWNFSGRQNDSQGFGDIRNGNWITGIRFLDEIRLGNLSEATDSMKSEKALNKYYMLPFILGILGMFYQYRKGSKGKQDFWVVMLLFFLTGLAIIIFLNQSPREPRERDYAYAGSFYAYAIWIGLGVLYLWELLKKRLHAKVSAIAVVGVCFVLVPLNMAAENWDDHSRAGRYATIAHAKNYLNSCAPNALLFTYGDNDTFPLWYAQEVEGIRRDIRIVNLSLLAGGWYIDMMNRKAYESEKVKMSVSEEQYHDGVRDIVYVMERFASANIHDAMDFIGSDKAGTMFRDRSGESHHFLPTRMLYFPVDKEKVIANGTVDTKYVDRIVDRMEIRIKGEYLNKSQWMMLNIIAANDWERPVYFGVGMGADLYMGFEEYFQLEGAAYRVVPIKTPADRYMDYGMVNDSVLYDHIQRFDWGNMKDPQVNIDNFHKQTVGVMKYRNTMLRLSQSLIENNQPEKAVEVLNMSLQELPIEQIPIDPFLLDYIPAYYALDKTEEANGLVRDITDFYYQELKYFHSLSPKYRQDGEVVVGERNGRYIIEQLKQYAVNFNQPELAKEIAVKVESIYNPAVVATFPTETREEPVQLEVEYE